MDNYVKVGEKAESFSDPLTSFNIIKGEIKKLSSKQKSSPKIKRALTGGHLSLTDKHDFEEFEKIEIKRKRTVESDNPNLEGSTKKDKALKEKIKTLQEDKNDLLDEKADWEEEKEKLLDKIEEFKKDVKNAFKDMTEEELIAYYKKTYDVTKDEIKIFSEKSQEEMVEELKSLEE